MNKLGFALLRRPDTTYAFSAPWPPSVRGLYTSLPVWEDYIRVASFVASNAQWNTERFWFGYRRETLDFDFNTRLMLAIDYRKQQWLILVQWSANHSIPFASKHKCLHLFMCVAKYWQITSCTCICLGRRWNEFAICKCCQHYLTTLKICNGKSFTISHKESMTGHFC